METKKEKNKFMLEAIGLAQSNVENNNGGPFGAVVVKNGKIVGKGNNQVTSSNDPTAHAEVVAIREASKNLGNFNLEGCEIYASCEPCPMCLGAIYWARINKIYYAGSQNDAAKANFDDSFIYNEISLRKEKRNIPSEQIMQDKAQEVFEHWIKSEKKIPY